LLASAGQTGENFFGDFLGQILTWKKWSWLVGFFW
jgi:hypothetical protein